MTVLIVYTIDMDSGVGDGPGCATREDPKAEKSQKRQLKRDEKERKRQRNLEQERRQHEIAQAQDAQRRAAFTEAEREAERRRSVVRQWMIEHNMTPDKFDEWIEELDRGRMLFEFSNFFHVMVLNQEKSCRDAFAMVGKWAVNRIESVGDVYSALKNHESQKTLKVTRDTELYHNWIGYAKAWEAVFNELLYAVDDMRRYERIETV